MFPLIVYNLIYVAYIDHHVIVFSVNLITECDYIVSLGQALINYSGPALII